MQIQKLKKLLFKMEFLTLFPLISRVSRQPAHLPDPIEQLQIECALFFWADSHKAAAEKKVGQAR